MKRLTGGIIVLLVALALPLRAGEEESDAAAHTVTLRDGTVVHAVEVVDRGCQLYVRLIDGRMFAYSKRDVEEITSRTGDATADASSPSGGTPSPRERVEPATSASGDSRLGLVAGGIHIKQPAGEEIELTGFGAPDLDNRPSWPASQPNTYLGDLIEHQTTEHQTALQDYEEQLLKLVSDRDELIEKDYQATRACNGFQTVFGVGTVSLTNQYGGFWSGFFSWNGLMDNYSSPTCQAILADCDRLAYQVVSGLDDLALFARQNGILPGEARGLLNKYALNVR